MTDTLSLAHDFKSLAHPAQWQRLAPDLHVGDSAVMAAAETVLTFDDAVLAGVDARLLREGYFQLPPLDWGLDVGVLARGVSAVTAAGHLPVFAFMYDEVWVMYARLRALLTAVLTETYMMLPAFWMWHVDGKRERAGWTPHRDNAKNALLSDRSLRALTLWVPLTDATPVNGCMYVLPADRDPLYGNGEDAIGNVDLQDVRALPSPAGGLLGWSQGIFHWGGRASANLVTPRISMAVEFQRGDEMPIDEPLLPPEEIPSLELRLRLILRQVLQYQHMYPLSPDLKALAEAHGTPRPALKQASASAVTYGLFKP